MISKIVTVLSILSISAYGNESNQKSEVAVSSQSFHRDDVPLSYKFSAIHDTKPKKHDPISYPSIQYAPLPETKPDNRQTENNNEGNQNAYRPVTAPLHLIEGSRHIYSTEGIINKDHLEPRLEENNHEAHKQSYRSNIPGYNVRLIPQPSNAQLGPFDDLVVHHVKSQIHQARSPNFFYQKKPNGYGTDTPTIGVEEPTTTSQISDLRGFLPENYYLAFQQRESKVQPNAYSLQNELAFENRQQSYQHVPRLHLNIARIYNIANTPKKVPFPPANIENPVVKSRGLWTEYYRPNVEAQKTILYPVPR